MKTCSKCGVTKDDDKFYRGRCNTCSDCDRKASKAYYESHLDEARDKAKIRQRAYREENPEKVVESRRRYYETHRDEIRAACKRWVEEHREEIAAYQRRYQREWHAANRERCRVYWRNREARKRGNGGSHSVADVRAQHVRQKGRCFWCRRPVGDDYHVDHVVPIALGGSNGPENIVVACAHCNLTKSATHPMDWAGTLL